LRDGFEPEALPQILPNLKVVLRDRAHATRRLAKRGWWADSYLKERLLLAVYARSSITSLIQNSATFQEWFANAVSSLEQQPGSVVSERIRNLRLARQRFDSTQKPLGRFVLFMPAVLDVALKIASLRTGEERGSANAFLTILDSESVLQLSMLADAGDETLMLTRLVDTEEADPAKFPSECQDFLQRVLALFGDGEACWHTGYTP
jgi:hypothetical protein